MPRGRARDGGRRLGDNHPPPDDRGPRDSLSAITPLLSTSDGRRKPAVCSSHYRGGTAPCQRFLKSTSHQIHLAFIFGPFGGDRSGSSFTDGSFRPHVRTLD